jgi:hypothetical protein
MPATKKSTILKRIEKLSEKNADPIRIAVALAHLDAETSSPPDVATLMMITGKSRRTISYLRSIGKRLGELHISERTFVRLGWTKSVEIARLCTHDTLSDALAYAEDHTVAELRAHLTGESAGDTAVLLRLTSRQYNVFEQVLLAHGAVRVKPGKGVRGKEAALTKALKTVAIPAAKKS